MQKTIFIILIGIILYSCSNTKLVVSMKQKDLNPKAYNKLVVAALLPDEGNRLLLEEAIVEELTESGIKSGISFFTFPLAGRKDIISNLTYTKEELKKVILDKIKKNKIDALMIISLLDTKKEVHYVEANVVLGPYYDPSSSFYGQYYYDYFSYIYNSTYSTGYYTTETSYFVQINLYDIETEKLLWTGQTLTANMKSLKDEAGKYAKMIVKEILEKEVLLIN